MVALSVHVPSASAESVATIVTMSGPAEIEKDGSNVVGVTTGADTTVIVQIDATHDLTVYQNTQLRLGDVLAMRVGTVRVRGSLTVATANARSSVRDSEMTVVSAPVVTPTTAAPSFSISAGPFIVTMVATDSADALGPWTDSATITRRRLNAQRRWLTASASVAGQQS